MADYTAEDVAKLRGTAPSTGYTGEDVAALRTGVSTVALEERGLVGETVAGFKRGGLQLVDMAGNIARAIDPAGGVDVVRDAGFGLSRFAKARASQPDVAESSYAENHPILGNIPKAAEMVIPSVGVPLAAGVGAAAAGLSAPAAAAAGVGGAGLAFGLSQFQDTKERGLEKGLTESDATTAGIKTGLSEGVLEAVSNVIPAAKLFSLGKPVAGTVLKSLFKAPSISAAVKTLANDAAQIMTGEVSTEMAQAYTQGLTEKNAGIRPDADPWQESKDVIGPTIALSLMLGGAVGGANKLSRVATERALTNEKVGEDVRVQAAGSVYQGLLTAEVEGTAPVGSAENFKRNAEAAIKAKAPIPLSDDLLQPAKTVVTVAPEEALANVVDTMAAGASPSEAIEAHNEGAVGAKLDVNQEGQDAADRREFNYLTNQPYDSLSADEKNRLLDLDAKLTPVSEEAQDAADQRIRNEEISAEPGGVAQDQTGEGSRRDITTHEQGASPQTGLGDSALNAEGALSENIAPTGEILDEPVEIDPLDTLKGYKTKEAAYKEIRKSGRLATHETAVRSDGQVVIVPKPEPVISEPSLAARGGVVQAGAVGVKEDFAAKGVANATQMIAHNEAAKTNSDSLANHPNYDGSFDIPVQGGLQAAKSSTKYETDAVYREKVDAFERDLDLESYNLRKQQRIMQKGLDARPAAAPAGLSQDTDVRSEFNVDSQPGLFDQSAGPSDGDTAGDAHAPRTRTRNKSKRRSEQTGDVGPDTGIRPGEREQVVPGGKPVKVADNEVVAVNAENTQAVWAWESQTGEVFKTYADINPDGSVDIFSLGIADVDRIAMATAFNAAGLKVVDSKGVPYAFGKGAGDVGTGTRVGTEADTTGDRAPAEKGDKKGAGVPKTEAEIRALLGATTGIKVTPKLFSFAPDEALSSVVHKIAEAFGHKVQAYTSQGQKFGNGFVVDGTDTTIYLNKDMSGSAVFVLGHELTHQLKTQHQEVYDALTMYIESAADPIKLEKRMAEMRKVPLYANLSNDELLEEIVADLVAHEFQKSGFWDTMAQAEPTLFAKLLNLVQTFTNFIKQKLSGNLGDLSSDLKRLDKVVTAAFTKYAQLQKQGKIKGDATGDAAKFAAQLAENPTAKTINEWFKGSGKNLAQDIADKVMRFLMPTDRTITMAASQKNYARIRDLLLQYKNQRQGRAGDIQAVMGDAQHIVNLLEKAFKTKADEKALADLVFKATEYQLHAGGAASGWKQESWEAAGMQERFGKTLVEAQADLTAQYRKFTPDQKVAHEAMIDQLTKVYLRGREAALAPWLQVHGQAMFNQAEKYNEDVLKAEEWSFKNRKPPVEVKASEDVKALAATIKMINDRYPLLRGDYMPLMRFGDYVVRTVEMDENGETGKRTRTEFFDSQQDAIAYTDKINNNPSNGLHAELATTKSLGGRDTVNIPATMIDKLKTAAQARGLDGDALALLIQDAEALRINMMPRLSTASHKLQREGVEGYSRNVYKVFATYIRNHANANAGLIHGSKIEQTFRDMGNEIKAYTSAPGYDPKAAVDMDRLYKHLYENERASSRDKINGFVQGLGKASFLWYLSSPSIWAVQWSQPFMVTIPKMAAKFGYNTAFKAYTQAAKQYLHGDFSDEKIDKFNRDNNYIGDKIFDLITKSREEVGAKKVLLEKQIKDAFATITDTKNKRLVILKVLSLQGRIDLSASHSLQDLAAATNAGDRFVDKVSTLSQKGMTKAGFFMQHSETGSRRAAAIAAFELALKDGSGFVGANDYASDIINDTLFDFDTANRGRAWQGNTGHVLGQFQFFRMHMLGKMLQLVKDSWKGQTPEQQKQSREELAYMTGTSMALAGASGTPIALALGNTASSALWSALSFMFGDDDDPWDLKRDFEMAVREGLGETAGSVVLKGLPSLVGMDVSQRIGLGGMGDVVMGDPPAGASGTAKANWYAGRILGPAWGMVSDTIRASDALADGDIARAIQYSSPKVLRDFVKTYELSEHGVQGGGKTVLKAEDVNSYSYALMLVGINPADVSLASEESRHLKSLSTALSDRRSMLMRDLAAATLDSDLDAKDAAIEKINKWSETNPKLKITAQELASKIKSERKKRLGVLTEKERLIKSEYGG